MYVDTDSHSTNPNQNILMMIEHRYCHDAAAAAVAAAHNLMGNVWANYMFDDVLCEMFL
jgi:hypothetical protein